jgi:uncharacterized membrane protein YsdA (DUF1294 family)
MKPEIILLGIFTLINLIALFVMGRDKKLSRRGSDTERTPEGLMFFLAAFFGAIGVLIGMHLFRHKTRKWYFQFGIPLLIIQNVATLYVAYLFLITH